MDRVDGVAVIGFGLPLCDPRLGPIGRDEKGSAKGPFGFQLIDLFAQTTRADSEIDSGLFLERGFFRPGRTSAPRTHEDVHMGAITGGVSLKLDHRRAE